jgi:hypothetical protein
VAEGAQRAGDCCDTHVCKQRCVAHLLGCPAALLQASLCLHESPVSRCPCQRSSFAEEMCCDWLAKYRCFVCNQRQRTAYLATSLEMLELYSKLTTCPCHAAKSWSRLARVAAVSVSRVSGQCANGTPESAMTVWPVQVNLRQILQALCLGR